MAVIKGKDGVVSIGVNNVARVTSFSVTIDTDTLETTAMGNAGWKEFVGSLQSFSGSLECLMDSADNQHGDLPSNGSTVTLTLDTGGSVYTGDVFITSVTSTAAVAELVTMSFDFQGTGALTIS